MAGGFDELRVVECGDGLEGSVGAVATHGADFAAGGVEDVHAGRRRIAGPKSVETAPVESITRIAFILFGVALGHRDGFPDAVRLVGLDAWPANPVNEEA